MADLRSVGIDKVISAAMAAANIENTVTNRITFLKRYKEYVNTGLTLYGFGSSKDDYIAEIDKKIDNLLDQIITENAERNAHEP